jgi:hypothetical protein
MIVTLATSKETFNAIQEVLVDTLKHAWMLGILVYDNIKEEDCTGNVMLCAIRHNSPGVVKVKETAMQ